MNRKLKGKIIEKFGTQFEFAKVINEHESNISRIILGRRQLSEKDKKVWANVLGGEVKYLFEEDKVKIKPNQGNLTKIKCPYCETEMYASEIDGLLGFDLVR